MHIAFDGQAVLITGAAHGFGRQMSIEFSQRGALVWACDLLGAELDETRALCEAAGGRCEVRTVDITNRDAVHALVQEAGDIAILINNAGGVLGQVGKPLEEVSAEDWNAILAVNVSGAFWCSQAVAPSMKAARHGRIINISSGAGLGRSLTGIQAYATAKAGLVNLTRQLAYELGPYNITVNCIAPGFVRSNANTERQWESYGEDGQRRLVEGIALRRLGTPQDIAYGALYFASEYAGWVTGQVLSIDGGK